MICLQNTPENATRGLPAGPLRSKLGRIALANCILRFRAPVYEPR